MRGAAAWGALLAGALATAAPQSPAPAAHALPRLAETYAVPDPRLAVFLGVDRGALWLGSRRFESAASLEPHLGIEAGALRSPSGVAESLRPVVLRCAGDLPWRFAAVGLLAAASPRVRAPRTWFLASDEGRWRVRAVPVFLPRDSGLSCVPECSRDRAVEIELRADADPRPSPRGGVGEAWRATAATGGATVTLVIHPDVPLQLVLETVETLRRAVPETGVLFRIPDFEARAPSGAGWRTVVAGLAIVPDAAGPPLPPPRRGADLPPPTQPVFAPCLCEDPRVGR